MNETSIQCLICIGSIIAILYAYFRHSFNYWKNMGVSQLNPTFPFGDMADVIFRKKNMGDKIKEIYDRMKGEKYVGLYFFSRKAFLPLDPVLIKHILSKDFHHFYDRGIYYDEENDPLSAHLFSIAGPKWKHLRSKLTPAYSPNKLKFMFTTILDCGHQMTDLLKVMADKDSTIEIKEILARYTTDVIGSCAFGLECNSMKNPEAEFRLMGKRAFTQTVGDVLKMVIIRSFPRLAKLFNFGVFSSPVTNFFQRVVRETIEYRENNNITRKDFLHLLIQLKNNVNIDTDNINKKQASDGTSLTVEEAAAQAFIFFLAGFETTSTTISFAMFEIASNQEIQEKVREEMNNVLKKYHEDVSYDMLMDLPYLDTVISETLRKYPPAPVFLRKCTKTYRVPDSDVWIEKDLSVLIPAYGLHRDPEYFPEPDKFDPDRFNEENKTKIWDYSYIPFGDGPRACLGMRFSMIQIKIALILTLKEFNITLSKKTILPLQMETKGIILSPIGGLWFNFNHIKQ
ncbi:unnamed protein product [Brassicogethes aeneus]|uniref:Cytochrome P450 n=1 Tax=Brassicogethes aeneus TaxID=1431903 RepID=A0A9P0AZI0_BRAAE|nr:unnamed protein product [Brassicogethes aeneus]